jgi:hypothetical protein
MYGDSVVGGGNDEFEDPSIGGVGVSEKDGNGEDRVGICGVREVSDGDLKNKDVSYAIVVSNIWRKRMRASRKRRCFLEGIYAAKARFRWIKMHQVVPSRLE